MAKVRKPREGMSYVALRTEQLRPVFEIARVSGVFVETLLHYRKLGHYKLHAYVVLADHVHLLLTPQGLTLEQTVALIKQGFAHRVESAVPLWEEGFARYPVANIREMEIVRAYLHQLPVQAGLVAAAELYPFSSAYRQDAPEIRGVSPIGSDDSLRKPADSTTTPLRKVAS